MCQNFFDVRTFGAVMTTFMKGALNCGPVQRAFSTALTPSCPRKLPSPAPPSSPRRTRRRRPRKWAENTSSPYALYRCEGYISANLARKTTGFPEEDLELLWNAILNMFEFDRAVGRGKMAVRELIIFRHDSVLGNAPAHKLFDLIKVTKHEDAAVPRSYADYDGAVDTDALPSGVTCERRN